MENDRQSKCRYITKFLGNKPDEKRCVVDGWEPGIAKLVTPEDCEKCERYKSCYIEYPIEVSEVNSEPPKYWENDDCGKLFWIRPFGDEYEKKAYIGFLLGEFPFTNIVSYTEESKELHVSSCCNIAFFVPELKKIIFGKDAWWKVIDEPPVQTQTEKCELSLAISENF